MENKIPENAIAFLLSLMCIYFTCMLSCFSHVRLFVTLWIIAYQTPLSMGFSRQECWSGLWFPTPGGSSWSRNQTLVLRLLHCRQSMMDRSWKRSERDSGHKRMKGRKRRAAQHSLGPDDLHQRCTGKTENHREQAKANPYSFKFLMNIVSWLNLLLKSTK